MAKIQFTPGTIQDALMEAVQSERRNRLPFSITSRMCSR